MTTANNKKYLLCRLYNHPDGHTNIHVLGNEKFKVALNLKGERLKAKRIKV